MKSSATKSRSIQIRGRAMRILAACILALCMTTALSGETIFTRDGRILEGKITEDANAYKTIKTKEGEQKIPRREILRVLYSEDYKTKVHIYLKVGSPLEGHVVDDKGLFLVIRPDLEKREEIQVARSNVVMISTNPLTEEDLRKRRKRKKTERKEVKGFTRNLGLRVGTSTRFGEIFTNRPVEPLKTWNWETVFFQLYYYDHWYEFNLAYQPPMKPGIQNYNEIQDAYNLQGSSFEDSTDFSNVSFTGYPLQFFNVNLGITLGHMHHRIKWIRADNLNSAPELEYLSLSYHAFTLGFTYRFISRLRIGANILLPYLSEMTYQSPDLGSGNFTLEKYESGSMVPGFSLEFTAFVFQNLSISAEYFFMYNNLRRVRSDTTSGGGLENRVSYLNHRVALSVGYGFNL